MATSKVLLLAIVPVAMFLAIWQFLSPAQPPAAHVAFSEFLALAHADKEMLPHVEAASIKGREIVFWVKDPAAQTKAKRATTGPDRVEELTKDLIDHKVAVAFEAEESSVSLSELVSLVAVIAAVYAVWCAGRARGEATRANDRASSLEAELGRLASRIPPAAETTPAAAV